ncbi:hypothetical protein O1M63_18520 [Streptomyces mirabilis]|nr:hypothetical protein [Streptomyces mirabilis]
MSHDTPQSPAQGPAPVNCVVCEGEFIPHPRQIYCSPRCKVLARRAAPAEPQTHSCPACGGDFTANPVCGRSTAHLPAAATRRSSATVSATKNAPAGSASPCLRPPCPVFLRRPGPHAQRLPPGCPGRDPLEPTATRNCPHCQQPVTIVALLATPEAARPTMPAGPDVIPLRRTPERARLTVTDHQGPATFGRRALASALRSPPTPQDSKGNQLEGRANLAIFKNRHQRIAAQTCWR